MRNRVARSLVFACSLLLAFPPAWCCMALDLIPAAKADEGDATEPAPAKCHTCGKAPSLTPAGKLDLQGRPKVPPAPCPMGKCCWERNTTPPTQPQQFQPDHSIVAVLPVASVLPVLIREPESVTLRAFPVSPPIHVFDCVWLC
jgi:hypothetical protein